MVNVMPRPFYSWERTPVSVEEWALWAPKTVRTIWRREKCLDFAGVRASHSLVAVRTVLSRRLLQQCVVFKMSHFRRVLKIAKSDRLLHRVSPSTWNNSAPTVRIFIKFRI
jgi:hypothetical protein